MGAWDWSPLTWVLILVLSYLEFDLGQGTYIFESLTFYHLKNKNTQHCLIRLL